MLANFTTAGIMMGNPCLGRELKKRQSKISDLGEDEL